MNRHQSKWTVHNGGMNHQKRNHLIQKQRLAKAQLAVTERHQHLASLEEGSQSKGIADAPGQKKDKILRIEDKSVNELAQNLTMQSAYRAQM